MLLTNAADINNILNIVLIVLFAGAIVGLVFAIIRGIYRGFWKSTFYLAWFTTLILLAVFTMNPLIEAIGNTDLSSIGYYLNMTVGDQTYSIAVTTIKETLHGGIAMAMTMNGLDGSAAMISERAWVLATAVIKYGVFIVDILLILILGTFFGWLLWFFIFKRIIPKVVRKRVKLRVVSALEESVMFVVLTGLFLSPFTSLVNIANQAWQKSDHTSENETMQMVDQFMDTYNDSLFAKTFFNWTVDENGLTLDAKIINEVTKSTAEDISVSVLDTISGLGEVGTVVAGALVGNPSEGQSPIDMGYLLSETALTQIFNSINKSQIISYALPLVVTLALNVEQVQQIVDPKIVDLSDIDWLTQLQNLETVVLDVLNSGIVDDFINPSDQAPVEAGSEQSNGIKDMVDKMLSDKAYPYVTRIFNTIDQNDLLKRVVPSIMWYVTEQNPSMGDMMPKTWEEMNLMTWGSELNIVYDNLFRLNKQAPELVETLVTMGGEQPNTGDGTNPDNNEGPKPLKDINKAGEGSSDPTSQIMQLVIDNMDSFAAALIGEFDENGKLKNVDQYGRSEVYDKNGNKIPGRHYTLMDSTLFSYVFPNLINQLTSSMTQGEQPLVKPETLNKAFNKLESGVALKNYKQELGALFTAFKGIMNNETIKKLILTPEQAGDPMEMFTDSKFINSMVNLLPAFKASEIFKIAIEPMMVDQITSQKDMLDQIGLKAESITSHLDEKRVEFKENEDGYYDYFFDELAFLLKQMPNMLEISNLMKDSSGDTNKLFNSLFDNVDKLAGLLDAVYESDILNPETKRTGIEGNNFFNILSHLFNGEEGTKPLIDGLSIDFDQMQKDGFIDADARYLHAHGSSKHKWTNTKTSDGDYLKDNNGHPIFDGETGYIANVLVSLGAQAKSTYKPEDATEPLYVEGATLISVLTGGTTDVTQIVGRLDKDFNISNVFAKVDNSTLFSSVFGPFLDNTLKDTGLIDEETSFKNIIDWTQEGKNFAAICDSIDEVGIDLTNFNIENVDNIPALNIMLHSLADSQLFESKTKDGYYYNFNSFLYSKLKEALGAKTDPKNPDVIVNKDADMLADPYTKQDGAKLTYTRSMKNFDVKYDEVDKTKIISAITSPTAKSESWVNDSWMNKYMKYSSNTGDLEKYLNENGEGDFYTADNIASVCNVLRRLNETKTHAEKAYHDDNDPKPPLNTNDITSLISSKYVNLDDLENLLQGIYACKPAQMILYNAIASLGNIKLAGGIDLKAINAEFFIYEENQAPKLGLTGEKLKEVQKQELSNFVDIYRKLNEITKDSNIQDGDFEKLLKDKVNIVVLNEILQMMNQSYCLHRAGKAVLVKDFVDDSKTTHFNKTVFQSLIETFTLSPMIMQMLYRSDSPKDTNEKIAKSYRDYAALLDPDYNFGIDAKKDNEMYGKAKAFKLLEEVFPTLGVDIKGEKTVLNFDKQEEESSKLIEIASSLLGGYKNVHGLISAKDNDGVLSAYTYTTDAEGNKIPDKKVDDLINSKNISTYIYDGLPSSEIDPETKKPIPTMDFTLLDYRHLTGDNIEGIIKTINSSDLLYDLAPNALKEVFSGIGNKGSGSEGDILAKALQKAEPYYLYELGQQELGKTDISKYETRFYRTDIDIESRSDKSELSDICSMVDSYVDILKGKDNAGNIFEQGLDANVINLANELLNVLSSSYIFHRGRLIYEDTEKPISYEREESSFESLFAQFYINTGFTKMLGFDHDINGTITPTGTKQLMARIFDKTWDDFKGKTDVNSWTKEIGIMCALARKADELGLTKIDGFKVDTTNPIFAPDNVSDILVLFNNIDTCDGAINKIVGETFDTIGFKELTKYQKSDVTGDFGYAIKTALSQDEWGGIVDDNYVPTDTGEIANIKNLLNCFSNKDALGNHIGYISFNDSAVSGNPMKFISERHVTEQLLNFLHDSYMFKNEVNDVYVDKVELSNATAESLFFYNILDKASLTQFINGKGLDKINTIYWLMNGYEKAHPGQALYVPKNEAIALDTLLAVADNFTGGNFEFDNLNSAKEIIYGVMASLEHPVTVTTTDGVTKIEPDLTKTHGRSYLSSEMIGSILDSFMDIQMQQFDVEFTFGQKFNSALNYKNINPDSYRLLNMTEANAIVEILNVFDKVSALGIPDEIIAFFSDSDKGMQWSNFEYAVEDADKGLPVNSYIASVIYTSNINPILSEILYKDPINFRKQLADANAALKAIPYVDPESIILPDQSNPYYDKFKTEKDLMTFIRDNIKTVDEAGKNKFETTIEAMDNAKLTPNSLFANPSANADFISFSAYGMKVSNLLKEVTNLINGSKAVLPDLGK